MHVIATIAPMDLLLVCVIHTRQKESLSFSCREREITEKTNREEMIHQVNIEKKNMQMCAHAN